MINPSKKILVWKTKIPKVMTEQQRNKYGMNSSGHSWVKNMSRQNEKKWIARLFSKSRRIEIQKTLDTADLKIIIAKVKNHTKLQEYEKANRIKQGLGEEYIVSLGQNGTSFWKEIDILEFYQAIQEAMDVLRNLS